jgi:ribonuclease BN (tRNA processing enzyme)
MHIKILGNGGAISNGLPYNAFVINQTLLCETPPDIMPSLHRNGIEISSIKTIYISHLHGDHTFGLPFLMLSAFFRHLKRGERLPYTIVGPEGLEKMAQDLIISAFTARHHCLKWMKEFCTFVEVDESSRPDILQGYQVSLFKLNHLVDTFGFYLSNKHGRVEFAYVADTLWCESISTMLESHPQVVLIDLNGKDDDPERVHLSMSDLKQNALPITGEDTRYYGTHLVEEFTSTSPCIRCAKSGMVISLGNEE